MKINLNKLYVGNIMVSDSYTVAEDGFGDHKNPRNTGYVDYDGQAELLLYLGNTYGGDIFLPVKWINGEHHLMVIVKHVEKFIRDDKAELKEDHKNILLRPVVYDVGKRYISDQKQLFPNNTKQAYLRDLKELRETIKQQNIVNNKQCDSNYKQIETGEKSEA